jgi:GT2 family glycosyltransferase
VIKIAALLTVYNRRKETLSCLKVLFRQRDLPDKVHLSVYLVDDGSTDGTSAALARYFPEVEVLQGTGDLYWNGGMRLAFAKAMKNNHDHYLWINNDTILFPQTLAKLLETSAQLGNQVIVAASLQDPETLQLTYGGVKRLHHKRPLKFTLIEPGGQPVPVETMNGNCVLIPQAVAKEVGNLDPSFTHGLGDFDYGLRARKLGFEIYLAPGYCGFCRRNPMVNKDIPFQTRWKELLSPLGLPPKEWAVFAKRYAGTFWPVFWISPYFKRLIKDSYAK